MTVIEQVRRLSIFLPDSPSSSARRLRAPAASMRFENIRLFSTDLDGTLLGDPAAAERFGAAWTELDPRRRPLLVYNTGRTIVDTRSVVAARQLPEPDYIIGSVGTELHDSLYNRGDEFCREIATGWNLSAIEEIIGRVPGVKRQPAAYCHPYKSSWFWVRARREDIEHLESRLHGAGLEAQVIYSCRYFLDIVPARGGKGAALSWLCRRLHIEHEHVLVAGDTGNDTGMFLLPGVRGIVVQNALPELLAEVSRLPVYFARAVMADGVLEGLRHFGVLAAPTHSSSSHSSPTANFPVS